VPEIYLNIRDDLVRKGLSLKEAKKKAAKIYNSMRKKSKLKLPKLH